MMNFLLFRSRYNAVCLEGINGGQCVPSCANGVFNNEVNSFRCDGLDIYIYIYIDIDIDIDIGGMEGGSSLLALCDPHCI